jgi:hypothetical protein
VPEIEERILHLEIEIDRLKPNLSQRLQKLEGKVNTTDSFGDKIIKLLGQALIPVISGAIILILGYAIKDSVDQALAKQQLQLSYATEMQKLLEKMNATKATREQIEAAALVLSTFGKNAVVPLVNELQQEGSIRAIAAENGLRAMALMETSQPCSVLKKLLSNQSRLYGWKTHQRAIRLIGDLDCKDALGIIKEYAKIINETNINNEFKKYISILRRDSTVNEDSIEQIKITLGKTMEVLNKQQNNFGVKK